MPDNLRGGRLEVERDPDEFDPISKQTLRDPHAAYARLRQGCPLAHGAHVLAQGDERPVQGLVALYPSANRDQSAFEPPDDLALGRPVKHLTA